MQLNVKANVFFADVDPRTGLIDPLLIEQKLKDKKLKIKIVTVVHLGGRVCDLERISKITKKYKCFLVEDACHAQERSTKIKKGKKLDHANIALLALLVFTL